MRETKSGIGRRWLGAGPGFAAAVLGIALSAVAFWVSRSYDTERVQGILGSRGDWRASDLTNKFSEFAGELVTPANFIGVRSALAQPFNHGEFETMALQLRASIAVPLRSISWVPRVKRADLAQFLKSTGDLGVREFRFVDQAPGGRLVEPGERDEYFPFLLVVPFEGQRAIPGLTLDSDAGLRATMARARDEGRPIASAPIPLITSEAREWALFILRPVYEKGVTPNTQEGRRAALMGFVVATFRLLPALTQAVRDTPEIISTLGVFPGGGPSEAGAVYSQATRVFSHYDPKVSPRSEIRIERRTQILGQEWLLTLDFAPATVSEFRSFVPLGWLFSGLLLTAAASSVLANQVSRRRAVEALVEERTAALDRANEDLRREVAQRKWAEMDIRAANNMLQAVFDESPFAIVSFSPDGKVLLWNRGAERIFGYAPEEAVGANFPVVPPEGQAEHEAIFARVGAGERVRGASTRLSRKDGKLIDVVFSGAPLRARDGGAGSMVFVLEDVTERLEVERRLQQSQRIEAVGQLTGGIAHDFNNILGVVIGNLDLALERLAADPVSRNYVDGALSGALRGAELVKSLLAFSRRQPLAPQPIDVNERLPELSEMLRRTLGEGVSVVTVPGKDLWPALADPIQLESAILNLAINARDAMPGGGMLTIETSNASLDEGYAARNLEADPGDYVLIAVSDTGTGMPPDVIERAFEPFFTTKGVGKGSGLGLSMIHGFARQSKGHVKIYSELGQGTTVRLYLPRAAAGAARAGSAPVADDAPTGTESILAVEDNPGLRAAAALLLAELGYRVRMAENAAEALRILATGEPFDLLFSDIVMPGGMNGIELAMEVAKRRPGIRVLFTTGFAEAAMSEGRSLPRGAAILSKPYRKGDLARALRRALGGTNPQRDETPPSADRSPADQT